MVNYWESIMDSAECLARLLGTGLDLQFLDLAFEVCRRNGGSRSHLRRWAEAMASPGAPPKLRRFAFHAAYLADVMKFDHGLSDGQDFLRGFGWAIRFIRMRRAGI